MPRALLVEDEPNIVRAVRMCLEDAGFEVEAVVDGVTAVRRALAEPPGIILLDLVIPDLDGFLVCEALRADPRTRGVPMLILSARAQQEDIERALALGADDYLVKPFRPDELLRRIRSCLDARRRPA